MHDITRLITEARSRAADWTGGKVRRALRDLSARYPGSAMDWEEGGEAWGRVVAGHQAVAYVSAQAPFAFMRSDDPAEARGAAVRLGIVAVAVADFDAPVIRVDPAALAGLATRPLTVNVAYGKASVNDLWWATV